MFITMKYPFVLMDISFLFHLISIAIKKKSNLIYDAVHTVGIFPRTFIQSLLLKNGFGADDNMGANTDTLEILFIFSGGFKPLVKCMYYFI